MSILALTLADFKEQLPFSAAIEERQIAPFIKSSYTFDILSVINHDTLEAIELLPAKAIAEYAAGTPVAQGDLVARRERVYLALVASPAGPPPGADWLYQPLQTLWAEYLKRYWIQASFSRFLVQHGFDFTKAGLTTPTDPQGTFRPAGSGERASVQASIDTASEAYRSRLTAFLHSETQAYRKDAATGYNYAYGLDTCHTPTSNRTRLRGINRRR